MTNEDTDVTNDLKPLSVHTATRRNRTLQLSHARSKTWTNCEITRYALRVCLQAQE